MTPHLDTLVLPSVSLWLDNILLERNSGFYNFTGTLKKVKNPNTGLYTFASPHRQWVYDSTILGSQVPNGITKNGSFIPAGPNVKLNFLQGGAFLSNDSSDAITVNYSAKEVNNYISHEPLTTVLFEKKFSENPKTNSFDPTNIADFVYPCIIIKTSPGSNKTLDFAQNVSTIIYVRLIFLSDSNQLYQNVCGILRDYKETHMPIFNPNELPFDEFGGLKNGSFDFSSLASSITQSSNRLAYIKDVSISEFSPTLVQQMKVNPFGAFIDIDLEILRFPR